jgi:hypothetical protein
MSQKSSGEAEVGLGDSIQTLLVSGIRLYAGITLYGLGQLQKIFDAATGDKGLPAAASRLESAFVDLSASLEKDMDETRKEALRSVSRVSAKAVERTFEALSPAAISEAGNRLLGRHRPEPGDVAMVSVPMNEQAAVMVTTVSAPLAVDVLSAPPLE